MLGRQSEQLDGDRSQPQQSESVEICPWCRVGTVECDAGVFWCTHCDYPTDPDERKAAEEEYRLHREEMGWD